MLHTNKSSKKQQQKAEKISQSDKNNRKRKIHFSKKLANLQSGLSQKQLNAH